MKKDKVDMELIRRYIRGELSPREMYALERRAQDDPAVMDIIFGMEGEVEEVHKANLAAIHNRIAVRVGRGRTRRLATAQRWAIAASVLIAFTLGTLWFTQWRTPEQSQAELVSAPTEAKTPRPEQPVTPEEGVASEGAAAVQSPQSKVPADQRQKRLAAAPTVPLRESAEDSAEAFGLTDRLTAAKQKRSMDTLDEIVVVGYGAQKKADLTGAVAVDVLIDTPVKENEQALAGRAPGIRIRGVNPDVKQPVVSGKIVDGQTQEPLSGVALQLTDGHKVVTDSFGQFVVADPGLIQSASFIGYELQSIEVVGKDTILLIMEPSAVSLSEVVVSGYGKAKSAGNPEPKDGWRSYRRYLKDERKRADGQKGTVGIAFTVDKDGRPADIKVIETTNENLNSLAVAIVLNGPDWQVGNDGRRDVEIQISF